MSKSDRPASPGDINGARRIEEMIRVDHAGEYGAVAIYAGQKAVFSRAPGKQRIAGQVSEMERQEQDHLTAFDTLIREQRVRPTALGPVWNAAGYALGVATALMGEKAAHACTEAVETVIEEHYKSQAEELRDLGETELADRFEQYGEEEAAHRTLATEEGAQEAPGYPLLSGLIKAGCRLAIRVSEKV